MLNELFLLQILLLSTLFYFTNTFNVITVWYLSGIYLTLLGWWLLLDDADIFVGFLWVIDLGVGLIFFIFILHYSTFLHQKPNLDKTSQTFSFTVISFFTLSSFLFLASLPSVNESLGTFTKVWFFTISWYDYYEFFFSSTVTDLNLLHEIYFTNNSFEFFLINFFLLYGIIASILASFLVKRVFNLLNFKHFHISNFFNRTNATYFVRTQDYLKQQNTSAGVRVWLKKKKHNTN